MKRYLSLIFLVFITALMAKSQILEPIKWSYSSRKVSEKTYELVFTAAIDNNWNLYSLNVPPGGPLPTVFEFDPSDNYSLTGEITESPEPEEKFDQIFSLNIKLHSNEARFSQKIEILTDNPFTLTGAVDYQACDDEQCIVGDSDFEFSFNSIGESGENPALAIESTDNKPVDNQDKTDQSSRGLWALLVMAFIAGLIALLTPCVFPMIPMTVSFFMHGSKNKRKSLFEALFFGISIIGIYTVIGTLVALIFGPGVANFISTHWIPNVLFFLIFVFFAAWFFGMFEINLPNWMISKSDKQVDKGGFGGPFFMAFTLVLVSFSCTGPIVGTILVETAGGELLGPIVGMLGFSLAFALPFTLFAIFPSWLSNLPKSGGWLNSVKVVLGFLELALGLKFLSIADQTYHWGILDREVYLAIWIVIFTLLGFYLLGKLRFKHDSPLSHVSVPRLMMSIISFSFVVYMIPGLFGAPLKALSGYLPPMTTHDFDLNKIIRDNTGIVSLTNDPEKALCEKPKYSDQLHLPHGLQGYFDYEQGLACAKSQNKPVFIDFTGHGCVNCRQMEDRVWGDPRVLKRLMEDYIIIALYVDDKKIKLDESEWVTSDYDGKIKKTLGKKYADFQITRFGQNSQPLYALLGTKGELLVPPRSYNLDVEGFLEFLDSGVKAFESNGIRIPGF